MVREGVPVNIKASNLYEVPAQTRLHPNFPNPFNPTTRIEYTLDNPTAVELVIYDLQGSRVKKLVAGSKGVGRYDVEWDGTNSDGHPVGSGVYYACLSTENFQQVIKMLLIR